VLTWPDIAAITLVLLIGAWAVLTGVLEIIVAIRLRRDWANEIWLLLSGLLSIIFGVLIFRFPGTGALAIAWIIGIYAIVFGVLFVILGFQLRSHLTSGSQSSSIPRAV